MAQADSHHSSRRATILGLASAAAAATAATASVLPVQGAAPVLAAPKAAPNLDPILAAIEAHRRAERELLEALAAETSLEAKLPAARRRSSVYGGDFDIVTGDDPRWIASVGNVDAAQDAADQRAVDMLNVLPQTPAGLAALLRYAWEHVAAGNEWPDAIEDDTKPKWASWSAHLHRNAAAALDAMIGR